MALRWVIGNLLTGEITADISTGVSSGDWADQLNAAAPVSATVPMDNYYDFRTGERRLALRQRTRPWFSYLACIDQSDPRGRVLQAGPITGRPWDDKARAVTFNASGMWQYMFRRVLIPVYTSGRITSLVTKFTAADQLALPDIAVAIVRQSLRHPNGGLPIDLPPVIIGGDSERQYDGYDAALLGDRLKELTEVLGGPDIMFKPYLADETHIRWRMVTGGDEDHPYIASAGQQRFEYSAPENGITGLAIDEDSTGMASRVFTMGGDSEEDALAGQAFDTFLTRQGYPLLEAVSDRNGVKSLPLLDRYSTEQATAGRAPVETWTMKFARNEAPLLSTYDVGDWAELNIVQHPWLESGKYDVRIVGLKGTSKDDEVAVTFQEGVLVDQDSA